MDRDKLIAMRVSIFIGGLAGAPWYFGIHGIDDNNGKPLPVYPSWLPLDVFLSCCICGIIVYATFRLFHHLGAHDLVRNQMWYFLLWLQTMFFAIGALIGLGIDGWYCAAKYGFMSLAWCDVIGALIVAVGLLVHWTENHPIRIPHWNWNFLRTWLGPWFRSLGDFLMVRPREDHDT